MVLQEQKDALKFVEKFLNVKVNTEKEKILVYILLEKTPRETFTSWNSITYLVTPEMIQKHEKLGAYEITHVVVNRLWPGTSVMLKEGIALAMDTIYQGNENRLHLLVYGLIKLGEGKPMLQLKPYEPFAQQIVGSFTLYLMRRYGVEKLKELLKTQKKGMPEKLDETVKTVYGRNERELKKEWESFLATCGPEEKAIAYAKAEKLYLGIMKPIVTKLRAYRNMKIAWGGADFFGSTFSVGLDAWKKVKEAYISLFESEDTESALETLKKALTDYAKIMERWFQAARKYQEALDLIYYKASKVEILQTLQKARELYESVGDIEMVEKIRELEKRL